MTRRPVSATRRVALALAVGALVATAGCSGLLNSGGDDAPGVGAANLDSVPADATMVGYVDVDGIAGDESLRSIANAVLQAQAARFDGAGRPASVGGLLSTFDNETGLSPAQVDGITFFGTVPEAGAGTAGSQYTDRAGMIVTSSLEESELVAALEESGYQPTAQTYAGTTVYTYGPDGERALAVFGGGTFAIGHVDSVKRVVDVRAGNAEPVGDGLREQFAATHRGDVRFAASVPDDQLPFGELQTDAPVDPSNLNTLQYVTGSLSSAGDSVTARVNLVDATANSAGRTFDLVRGGLAYYQGKAPESLRPAIRALSVEQNGNTVTVTFSEDAARIEAMIRSLYSSS